MNAPSGAGKVEARCLHTNFNSDPREFGAERTARTALEGVFDDFDTVGGDGCHIEADPGGCPTASL